MTHHVDISWNQSFTGGMQKRQFRLEGDRLVLSTPQSHDPIDGKMSSSKLLPSIDTGTRVDRCRVIRIACQPHVVAGEGGEASQQAQADFGDKVLC